MSKFDADVIIAGAGPSGLIVGNEAALGGAQVLILEKREGPTWSRAGNIQPRVLEIFASRGFADEVLARAAELHADPYSSTGIWAGLSPLHYEKLDSDYRSVLMLAQKETEKLLAARFLSLGGELRLRAEVVSVAQDEDGVTVTYLDERGARNEVRGRYLVGADGNRSAVRESAGIARKGTPARRIAVNVDAILPNPHSEVLTVTSNENGWAMTYPLRDGVTRFAYIDAETMCDVPQGALNIEEVKAALRRVHGTDYGIFEIEAINHFHDAMQLAERIRDRRIFLVGESVRIHYPASGVGMNFCIQDGFNLGWKLAAAVTDRAPSWLLDSYETERLPEIQNLLDDVRRQCAVQFNFDAEHQALKGFLERDVISNPQLNLQLCENLSGLSAAYPSPAGSHAIVGRRLPNLDTSKSSIGGSTVFELLKEQNFVLLDLTGEQKLPESAPGVRLVTAAADAGGRPMYADVATLLLRPDGHVAWASDQPLNVYAPEHEVREWLNIGAQSPVFGPFE